jgi:MFS transporter, DHA2 family, multidrug resistance protein
MTIAPRRLTSAPARFASPTECSLLGASAASALTGRRESVVTAEGEFLEEAPASALQDALRRTRDGPTDDCDWNVLMTDGLPNPQRALAFLTVAIALIMAVLDSAIVNVALPTIAKDLSANPADAIWVVNAYQLAVTVSLLPLASLGDSLGYRKVYLFGLALFTAASFVCAVAPNMVVLSLARAVQGVGAAGVMSVNIALVRFIFPSAMLGRGVGNTALVVAVSSAAGPSVAAAILSVASWHWLFLVNVPLGIFAFGFGSRTLPTTPATGSRLDAPSVVLNGLAFGLLIVGVDQIGSESGSRLAYAALAGAAAAGVLLVVRQLPLATPLLPIDLLRRPVFALSMATSINSFAAQALSYVALPFYFEDALRYSETATGLLMTPWPLGTAIIAPIAGRLADRYAPGLLGTLGLMVLATGLMLMATAPADPSAVNIVWRLAICGLGFGLFQSPNNKMIISSAPRERSGGASGLQSTGRLVGQSLGTAVMAVIFELASGRQTVVALWVAAILSLVGAFASGFRRSVKA